MTNKKKVLRTSITHKHCNTFVFHAKYGAFAFLKYPKRNTLYMCCDPYNPRNIISCFVLHRLERIFHYIRKYIQLFTFFICRYYAKCVYKSFDLFVLVCSIYRAFLTILKQCVVWGYEIGIRSQEY